MVWLGAILLVQFFGHVVFFCFCTGHGEDNVNWEFLFNPFFIYKHVKVNWFGAFAIATVTHVCIVPVALAFDVYKLCTVGRT